MKRYIYIVLSAILMLVTLRAEAQVGRRFYINAGWQSNATLQNPVAESFQGWGGYLEGGYYLSPKLAVGGFASFNTNNEYVAKATYKIGDGSAVTTDMDYSVYQIPFGATLRYRFFRHRLQPYIEAKLGAEFSSQFAYMSTYVTSADSWGFYASPEVGLTWHPFRRSNFGLQAAVFYSFATNRSASFGMNGINNLGFKLGFSF